MMSDQVDTNNHNAADELPSRDLSSPAPSAAHNDRSRRSKEPAEHGTLTRHSGGCRCVPCRVAGAAWQRDRRRQLAYGRWQPYVDAEPVRAHVRELMAAGLGCSRIAEVAGVNRRMIGHLLYGAPYKGAPPTRRIRPHHAAALLAVRPILDVLADGALTDATGTRRRLRALAALGWPANHLARQLAMNPVPIRTLMRGDRQRVTAATARNVAALYDQLWDTPGPSDATRARAARAGWPVPLAWDDESIDDPTARPATTAAKAGQRSRELWHDAEELRAQGLQLDDIADRLGVARSTLIRARERTQAARRRVTTPMAASTAAARQEGAA
jgi:plasmid maintenance system antidote protein VapI